MPFLSWRLYTFKMPWFKSLIVSLRYFGLSFGCLLNFKFCRVYFSGGHLKYLIAESIRENSYSRNQSIFGAILYLINLTSLYSYTYPISAQNDFSFIFLLERLNQEISIGEPFYWCCCRANRYGLNNFQYFLINC